MMVHAYQVVSHGQTTYFSFDMGAEKNKGLAYYRIKRKISGLATRDYLSS